MVAQKILTPIKAIRKKCLDCSGDSSNEVKNCNLDWCPLYPYRLGRNPNRKTVLTEEQKEIVRQRFAKARSKKDVVSKQQISGDAKRV